MNIKKMAKFLPFKKKKGWQMIITILKKLILHQFLVWIKKIPPGIKKSSIKKNNFITFIIIILL